MEKERKRIQLSDVAVAAGVSPKSVSLALRGLPGVAPETVTRIQDTARQLGYTPQGRSEHREREKPADKTIGYIYGKSGRRTQLIFATLHETLQDMGYAVAVTKVGMTEDQLNNQMAHFESTSAGIILLEPDDRTVAQLTKRSLRKPLLVVGGSYDAEFNDKVSLLNENSKEASSLAVDYFANLGHRKIAYIGEAVNGGTLYQERQSGFEAAMKERDLFDPSLVVSTVSQNLSPDVGFSQMDALLSSKAKMTAVLTANESLARGAIDAIQMRGLKIPDNISIMAFGGENWADIYNPPVTTIEVPVEQLVAEQVRWILGKVARKPEYEQSELRKPLPVIIPRKSVGPASK